MNFFPLNGPCLFPPLTMLCSLPPFFKRSSPLSLRVKVLSRATNSIVSICFSFLRSNFFLPSRSAIAHALLTALRIGSSILLPYFLFFPVTVITDRCLVSPFGHVFFFLPPLSIDSRFPNRLPPFGPLGGRPLWVFFFFGGFTKDCFSPPGSSLYQGVEHILSLWNSSFFPDAYFIPSFKGT